MTKSATEHLAPPELALPKLVGSRVAFAMRGLTSVLLLQGVCLGLSAIALTLAAGVHGELALDDAGLLWIALVNGLLGAAGWTLEQRCSPREVARRIDAALGQDGALFTAWEVESRARPGLLGPRLGREVAATCSARRMLRAILPSSAPILALPFVAAAVLFGVLEEARHVPNQLDLEALTRQIEQGLSSMSSAAGEASDAEVELTREEARELRDLMAKVAQVRRQLPQEGVPDEALIEVEDQLGELAADLAQSPQLREELDRTLNALDAARMAVEGRAAASAKSAPKEDSESSSSKLVGGTGLAPAALDGRMSGQESPPSPIASRAEVGVLGSRAWPRGYEGLVHRWVESRRLAAAEH